MGSIGTRAACVFAGLCGLAACGGTVETAQGSASVGASSGAGGAGTASASSSAASSSAASSGGAGGGSPECVALTDAIAEATGIVGSCTATVRLDFTSRSILGYHLFCGSYGGLDENAARMTAQVDTGQGQEGQSLAGPTPMDEYVFWQAAGDFGGSAVVSRRNGLSVFGGTTVWAGAGDITYPKMWSPASDLGIGCPPPQPLPAIHAHGFDLGSGQALTDADVSAAIAVVQGTVLPAGMWQNSYLFDAVVLLYPRSVGAFDPATAEWIVLLNSGWLE